MFCFRVIGFIFFGFCFGFCGNQEKEGGIPFPPPAGMVNTDCTPTISTQTDSTNLDNSSCSAAVYNAMDNPLGISGAPTCITDIAAEAPCWIKENFHCVTVTVSGTGADANYVITTTNEPPYKSYYYGSTSSYYEDLDTDGGFHGNPNAILAQNITLTIPTTPSVGDCNDGTAGIESVGISTLGVVIFNNQAAPGDSFATEYYTMDQSQGHPQMTGVYHYHTEPYKISYDSNALIGIALDGYPIYGKKDENDAYPTLDSTTHTVSCNPTEFPTGTYYCYHVENDTFANGYMLGSYFKGQRGSVD